MRSLTILVLYVTHNTRLYNERRVKNCKSDWSYLKITIADFLSQSADEELAIVVAGAVLCHFCSLVFEKPTETICKVKTPLVVYL